MKNEIAIFKNSAFGEIRVTESETGKPLFAASDVASALGYTNPRKAISDHCKGVTKRDTLTEGGMQPLSFIPEYDVYRLVMRSKLPQAEQFQDWVVEEVLPSIRKTGGYIVARLDETPDMIMARAILVAKETMDRMKKQLYDKDLLIAKQAPKVSYADRVLEHDNQMVDVGQASKLLKLPYGRNTFFAKLREDGIFFKNRNEPIQEYVDRKYFDVRKVEIPRDNHPGFTVLKVLVTPKGLYWLSKKYGGDYKTNIPSLQLQ